MEVKEVLVVSGVGMVLIAFQMSVPCSEFRRDDPARADSLNAEH